MLNIQQITSSLAQMPDQALQKYAAMNKNDPYIVSLAVSESNRRKKVRQAQQGMQGQMPQPKVVDQAVQGMAAPMPEDTGIARLNAGDMNFADGGIVAFADGGVPRFNGAAGSLLTGTEYAIPGYVQPQQLLGAPQRGAPENIPLFQRLQQEAEDEGMRYQVAQAQARIAAGQGTAADKAVLAQFEAAQRTASLERPGPLPASFDKYLAKPEAVAPTGNAAPKPDAGAGQKGPGSAGTGAGPTMNAPSSGIGGSAGLESVYKRLQAGSAADLDAVRKQRQEYATGLQDFSKQELADWEAEQAKQGNVFKGREERIAQQEEKLTGMKDQNVGLALMQAGAAMMSTPGGLGVALGRGVDVGTKQYAAGIDKLNAAQERLLDAKDKLDELKLNREDMTAKERRALTSQYNRSLLEGKKLFLDGAEKDFGYKREDAKTLFAGITTLAGHEISAGATVQAAKIKAQETKDYLEGIRGGDLVRQAQKNIMDNIVKANPYADEATRQRLYDVEWQKALQTNPALAKYSGGAAPTAPAVDTTGFRVIR